ncbi:hypothetical protein [Flintibacter muris]|uniref:hypothetical protein n=1 Tax=Flintibacter muris TaxID=2941327 RepID=UPI00203B6EAA|nr:hypothetical protein [Flintibacter muris]
MSAPMYRAGTLILYERRGVYEIESIGEPPSSVEGGGLYYKLRSPFSTSNEIIYTPVDTTAFMRPLIDKAQAAQYLELCSQLESCPFSSRKTMDLAAHYRGMLASCKLEDCLLLIKEIYAKQRELASHSKKLGQVDQQYLKLAERLVCEEFSAVLHTTPELVKKQLYAAMRRKTAVSKESAAQKAAL